MTMPARPPTLADALRTTATAPALIVAAGARHRFLLRQMIRRLVAGRYRGSFLGLAWSFLHPLLMLAVYTFVFGVIFHASWGTDSVSSSKGGFSLTLFAGLILFNIFAEVVNRSPGLVLENPNYVKKVVFPLEILPMAVVGEALFHAAVSSLILVVAITVFLQPLTWSALFFPLAIIPLVVLTVGMSWLLAALGVFIRDIGQSIGVITTVLFFMTPVFYPLTAVPERVRWIVKLNPLSTILDTGRRALLWNQAPDWPWFCIATALSLAVMCIGYAVFANLKRTFADVM